MEALGNKKGILKSLIKQLHEGASIEEIREKAKEILKELKPNEIVEVEQELIKEGISREEIQKLCSIHLEVFKESLEKEKISLPSWHPIYILMKEHEIILSHAEKLRNADEKEFGKSANFFKEAEKHYIREENILFPYLEKHGITEPPAIMWAEHDKIRGKKKELIKMEDIEEKLKIAEEMAILISEHFYKENKILFPTALRVISDEEWKEIRKEFDEIGYCCYKPDKIEIEGKKKKKREEINFLTGHLSKEEIEAIFNALPIDITFVDKNDEVKYFNQSKNRIFIRTKAIIGRKVQQCHPSKSIHIVNKILEEFKKGKRDVADFWVDMNGRKIYIRYFPVRKNGEYVGTIEVTQDITDIKKIEGEKRLLDWE